MNTVLGSAAVMLTVVALLRVGRELMHPFLYLFPTSSGTSPQLPGRLRRR